MTGRASIVITEHARKRLKERSAYKPRMFEKMANKAFDDGINSTTARNSTERNFILANEEQGESREVRIHDALVWIFVFEFGDFWLVTVKPVPPTLD